MADHLLIVESPSKAKTLKKYLGPGFEILASYGHVRDLVPKTGAVDPEHDFAMQYQLVERNEKHVDAIAKAVKKCDEILLATDPDREGEAIAWHLAEILKEKKLLKGKPLKRVVFYEITQNAVREAVAHPREILQPLVNAQQARRALDYLVGFNISPLLWKARRGLSAGRVQSPALRLIVEREHQIKAFVPQEYWSVHLTGQRKGLALSAKLSVLNGDKVEQFSIISADRLNDTVRQLSTATGGQLVEHDTILEKETLRLKESEGGEVRVARVDKKRKQRNPAAPFTTSTLQQEAVRKLGFTTDRTMKVAQQLYEGVAIDGGAVGLISYMRTDSVALSQDAIQDVRQWVGQHFDSEYLPGKPVTYANRSKNAQEAHEAIRPTAISRTPASIKDSLTLDQFRLYEMIWKRTVACQMSPAQFDTVAYDLVGTLDPKQGFRATGQTLVFPGFIAVYQEGRDESDDEDAEDRLPALEQGDIVSVSRLHGEQHFTQPPPRYTEASLVKALEEYGIGRPSTYASIISTLQTRDYALLDNKRFFPTDVGVYVNTYLSERFSRYVDYEFTARLEDQLDVISEGKSEWIPVLKEFWAQFSDAVAATEQLPPWPKLAETCPKCQSSLCLHLGSRGLFVGCSAYPGCDFTRNLEGTNEQSGPLIVGEDPESGLPILVLKGPYGPYVQLGEASKEDKKKPKRASLPKGVQAQDVTLAQALKWLTLPRDLGLHPESQKKVVANVGRFGPYLQHDGEFRSIPKTEDVYEIALPRALEILAQPKSLGRGALKSLGNHPDDGAPVSLHTGRYGPYVKHGKINATLSEGQTTDSITLEEALELLKAKSVKEAPAKKPVKKKVATAKKAAPKKAATSPKKPRSTKTKA
jgi:DNA topoisomerase-1